MKKPISRAKNYHMKKIHLLPAALIISVLTLFAFRPFQTGIIKGTITPATAARLVWAVSPTDTLKAVVSGGSFKISNAKTGTYKIMIDAASPYKSFAKDGIQVTDGQETNVGEIKLQK